MIDLASVLLLGIAAQWLAWRLRIPSILLLLLVGFAAGPVAERFFGLRLLDPDKIFGDSLLPGVSLAVSIILLEGGLSLRLSELRGAERAVRNIILFGALTTWLLAAVAAHSILGMSRGLAALQGAILVVTGPTVIIPLLRHVRPPGKLASVIRWEGIVTDPIGAVLAVLVFQVLIFTESDQAYSTMAVGLFKAISVGSLGGAVGAGLFVLLRRSYHVPDFLETSVALAIGMGVFVGAHQIQHESGLIAVTLMGFLLANQRYVVVEHIIEFKENLRVLLISSLFIVLSARLPWSEIKSFDWQSLAFVAVLILVVRPAAVFLSTVHSGLTLGERTFVAWMAPRGIVAAAVASVFSLELAERGYPDAERLVSVTFVVIVATVGVYGLTAAPVARLLGVSTGKLTGVLLVGAHRWAREIAHALGKAGVDVLLVDTNRRDIATARMEGLMTHFGSILSEDFMEHVSLDGLGHLVCLTHNDEVNSLACLQFAPDFTRERTYQLPSDHELDAATGPTHKHLRGRPLFSKELNFWDLQALFGAGSTVKTTQLSDEFNYDDFRAVNEGDEATVLPLFLLKGDGALEVVTGESALVPRPGDTLIALVPPEDPAPPDAA